MTIRCVGTRCVAARWAGLLLLAMGCQPEPNEPKGDPCSQAAEEAPTCELGTGEVLFEDIADGDEVGFVQGAQGGFHIPGSVRALGLVPGEFGNVAHPDNPLVSFIIEADGVAFGGYDPLPRPLKERSDGTLEVVGEIVPLFIGSRDQATGVTVDVRVEIEDICGTFVTDSREVTLVPAN